MENSIEKVGMDVKVLRLKRWYLPQAKSIAEINEAGISRYGQFVSFHNFHFWDVLVTDNDINSAYKAIRNSRKEHDDSDDIHVIQSMVLVGEKSDFWDKSCTTMFATMLQFSNVADLNYDELRDRITNSFEKNGISQGDWCMYYSLDFCDAVIFAKDVPIGVYQKSLWKMSLCTPCASGAEAEAAAVHTAAGGTVPCEAQGKEAKRYLRDTVTIYGIDSSYALEKFAQFKKGEKPDARGGGKEFGLSVELSIQSVDIWNRFKSNTSAYKPSIRNSLGRYDVQLVFEKADINDMLYIAFCLHEPGISSAKDAFCEYKIVPFVEPFEVDPGVDIALHNKFVEVAESALNKLLPKETVEEFYRSAYPDDQSIEASIIEYGIEFRRAIIALLKQSFSEEFAISILRSFMGYLNLINEKLKGDKAAKQSKGEGANDIYDEFITFQREYFRGVSMLIHCTMHSEKQFIQAPSFNSVICDVPPKLLAFYSGIAYAASEALNDDKQNKYSFLFVPDFRRDIYVKPISSANEAKQFIYIINLNERFFYDPKTAVPLVCHEVAHYVGSSDRKRPERAEELFKCLGAYLIYSVLPIELEKKEETIIEINRIKEAKNLVGILASSLAEEAMKKYGDADPSTEANGNGNAEANGNGNAQADSNEKYYLSDIESFVSDSSGFFTLLLMPTFRQSVIAKWQNINANDTVKELAKKIDQRLHSNYLTSSLDSGRPKIALEIIMAKLFDEIVLKFRKQDGWKLTCCEFFNNIATCFSEAYADLKMYELLYKSGDGGDGEIPYLLDYEKLPTYLIKTAASDEIDYSYYCRIVPVCKTLGINVPCKFANKSASEEMNSVSSSTIQYVQGKVIEYLNHCKRDSYDPQKKSMRTNIVRAFENLGIDDAKKQFGEIRTTIMEYRDNLEKYCELIVNGPTNKSDIVSLKNTNS